MINHIILVIFVVCAFTTATPTVDSICISSDDLDWRSYDNEVKLNDHRFNIKGLSWFGFETTSKGLYGLEWPVSKPLDWYLQWMIDNDFNALRLPFSIEFILNNTENQNEYKNVVHQAGLYGIMIMLTMSSDAADGKEKFYDISRPNAISCWEQLADLLKDEWNVFMVDVYSEPHDVENEYAYTFDHIFACT